MRHLVRSFVTAPPRSSTWLAVTGVAIGTAFLLAAVSIPGALRDREARTLWRDQFAWVVGDSSSSSAEAARIGIAFDEFRSDELLRITLAEQGRDKSIVPGLDAPVGANELWLSPALATLMQDVPADQLAARFPADARIRELPGSAIGAPGELVAVQGGGAIPPDQLAELTPVVSVSTEPTGDVSLTGRVVASFAAVAVLVPIGVFVGAAMRLSAARRRRRLANIRLVGASMAHIRRLLIAETTLLAGAGTAIGIALFYAARNGLSALSWGDGLLATPGELNPPSVAFIAMIVGLPLFGSVVGSLSVRKLEVSAVGDESRAESSLPSPKRLIPLAVGVVGFALIPKMVPGLAGSSLPLWIASFAAIPLGLVAAGAWITHHVGSQLARRSESAVGLLAGRRLQSDPRAGFRAVTGAVLALFSATFLYLALGALTFDAVSGVRPTGVVVSALTPFSADTIERVRDVVGVTSVLPAEAASLAVFWVADCDAASRVLEMECFGGASTISSPIEPGESLVELDDGRTFQIPADTPSIDNVRTLAPAVLFDGPPQSINRLLVGTDGDPATLERIRTATAAGVRNAHAASDASHAAGLARSQSTLSRVVDLALFTTLIVAGLSLAVTVAGAIAERRLPFALLRMTGTNVGELGKVVVTEATVPLLSAGIAAIGLGHLAGVLFVNEVLGQIPVLTMAAWLRLAVGILLALALSSAALPMLGRITSTDRTRFT